MHREKKGITCNETEFSKRVTDHSRVINALHQAIIADFLVGIVVQSLNHRTIIVQLYNRRLYDCTTIVVQSLHNRTIVTQSYNRRLYDCTAIVQRFLPENQ